MLTTVVGSYPTQEYPASTLKNKLLNFIGNYDPFFPSMENAVKSQIDAGVNIISDGQVRGEMVEVYARAVEGMAWEEGVSKIKSRLTNLKYSVSSNDLKTALNIAHRYADFEQKPLILNGKFQENMVGVKGIITGPTTLVLSSRLDGFYSRDRREQAIMDLALILKKEVKLLENAGASVIQVDEPFLSTGMADINTAHKAIEILGQDLQIPLAMHVCGDLRGVLQDLLNFPIDILDCEFAGNNTNLPLLEIHKLGDKKIGFGCIDTTKENVESADDIIKLVEKGIDIIGAENMIIDPDCGMRNLKEETAYNKLKNMTEAVRWLS